MKKLFLTMALAAAALFGVRAQTPSVNLTPAPYSMTVGDGPGLTIPADYTVAGRSLPDDMEAELDKFVAALNRATGFDGKVTDGSAATFSVAVDKSSELGTEGYTLKVTSSGVEITAPGAAGLYYAFQTLKKILPANVMAGVADHSVQSYVIPAVDITDKPTFSHRGFELDCARHFHSLDQVKRMIDVMSFYKMNRFHWHLTDDQGWRVEIEKYPRLTSVSSIAPDAYLCDFATRTSYLNGKPYGPYYYTKDEMREIVAYAAERHIEVFPEIEMPGHMVAAIAAYPEFSCNPDGDHSIWYRPGVSSDVLNVANPAVIQFCKDVLTEMAEVFSCPLVHIGGDETPSTAWENNAECRALMAEKGFTSPYQLQTWFTKQIADHLKTLGKQAVCWNEVVTKPGADLGLAREAGILIYDWLGGGTAKAAELGLNSVYCNTSKYYLDYPQGNDNEPRSMGHVITLPTVYDAYPDMGSPSTVIGVQGNLWCEYISDPRHVEYNALPRLIAIAETGWTPREKKNYDDFQRRVSADTVMWNLLGYEYGRHNLLRTTSPTPADRVLPDPEEWVAVTTKATTRGRAGRVLELVAEGSPVIEECGAQPGQLWTGAPREGSDAQMWRFVPDPAGSGKMALVCKSSPGGSVSPDPGSSSVDARWSYDPAGMHYSFILGEGSYYGQADNGRYFYSIRSALGDGFWLNCGTDAAGERLTVNCWHTPDDGDGGLWLIAAEADESPAYQPFSFLDEGGVYIFANASERFEGMMLADGADGPVPTSDPFAPVAWRVASASVDDDNSQTVTLVNLATARSFSSVGDSNPAPSYDGYNGHSLVMGDACAKITLYRPSAGSPGVVMAIDGKGMTATPSAVVAGGSRAVMPAAAGGEWLPVRATPFTFTCTDTEGRRLRTAVYVRSDESTSLPPAPEIEGYTLRSLTFDGTDAEAVYELTSVKVTYECRTAGGMLIARRDVAIPAGATHAVTLPEIDYFKAESSAPAPGTVLTVTAPDTVRAVYSTDAALGASGVDVRIEGKDALADGMTALIYDAHTGGRAAYRSADKAGGTVRGAVTDSFSPIYLWTLVREGRGKWAVYSPAADSYVGPILRGQTMRLADEPQGFSFDFADGVWRITSGDLAWDGGPDLTLHGWDKPGHPYWLLAPVAAPYYEVSVEEVNADTGETIYSSSRYVPAGSGLIWLPRDRDALPEKVVSGADGLDCITSDKAIRVSYSATTLGIEDVAADNAGRRSGVFDLSGRRLSRPGAPGIYIIDGRKTLVR